MDDLLVDQEYWVAVDPSNTSISMSKEKWEKIDRMETSMIQICLANSILLNALEEDNANKLWLKMGNLYQSKYLVNKIFLWNTLYLLRMNEEDSITNHLNTLNTVTNLLLFVDIKITEEEKCISLLCSLTNSWDILVMAIGRNTTTLNIDDVFASLFSEEMRRKNMEG